MTTTISPLFYTKNEELREIYKDYRNAVTYSREKVEKIINELVEITYGLHPDWSLTKILYAIAAENDDVFGLNPRSLYGKLSEENRRRLIDTRKYKRKKGDNNKK